MLVVPDLLASAGGVIVSYLEWVQNLQRLRWDEAGVNSRLTVLLGAALGATIDRARHRGRSLRDAAYEIAVIRVAAAAAARGYLEGRDVPAE